LVLVPDLYVVFEPPVRPEEIAGRETTSAPTSRDGIAAHSQTWALPKQHVLITLKPQGAIAPDIAMTKM
jgi:hypothetical protein